MANLYFSNSIKSLAIAAVARRWKEARPNQHQKVIPALAGYGLADQLVAMMKATLVFVTGYGAGSMGVG
jgi:hypothetical protein